MSSLALHGGSPVRCEPFAPRSTIGPEEKRAVAEVMDRGVLSQFLGAPSEDYFGGPSVRACERGFAERLRARHAVSVNSATTGLQVAVAAAEIARGDEVIVSPYTMSASAAAVLLHGAVPVFADVEDATFGLDPEAVAAAVTPRTTGIVVTHLFGHPARMAGILEVARRHGLAVVEDAAQSIGAEWSGRQTGTLGTAGVLSLNYHKIIHCGEGGIVLTDDERVAQLAQLARNHGEVVAEEYGLADAINVVGSNYRLTELQAAIAEVQLGRLDELLAIRRRLASRLSARLADIEGVIPPHVAPDCTHSYYVYGVRLGDEIVARVPRERFTAALRAEGIPVRDGYLVPLYRQSVHRERAVRHGFPVTDRLEDRELLIMDVTRDPLTERDVDDVADAFEKVAGALDALREPAP